MTKMFMGDVESHFQFVEKIHRKRKKKIIPGQVECFQTGL